MATVQHPTQKTDPVDFGPGYSFSRLVITSLLPLHYGESRGILFWLEAMLQIYRAFKKIYPETFAEELGLLDLGRKTLAEIWAETLDAEKKNLDHPLSGRVLGLLQKLFPIDEDIVYQDMVEGEGEGYPSIWIYPQFTAFTGDDLEEMLEHPEDQDPGLSSILFFILFDHQLGAEAWKGCRECFGWPVEYIDILEDGASLDDRALCRRLKKNGLYPFYDLWLSVAYATGNPFIDFDEYGNERQWELTCRNILYLKGQWEAAQPILDNCRKAEQLVKEDPMVLLQVAELIRQSLKSKEKQKG
jgi:hypothetical protein